MDRFKDEDRELSHHERDPEQRKERCWKCKGLGYHIVLFALIPTKEPCEVCHGVGAIDL
jgi:DnaJ-class molecular chaperone